MKNASKLFAVLPALLLIGCANADTAEVFVQGIVVSSFERSQFIICSDDALKKLDLDEGDQIWLDQDFGAVEGGDILQDYVKYLIDCEAEAQARFCPNSERLFVRGMARVKKATSEDGFGHLGQYQAEMQLISIEKASQDVCT